MAKGTKVALFDNPTTHHFMVTEVYQKQGENFKLIQFTFTALVR